MFLSRLSMPLDAEGYKGVFAFLWEDSQVPIFQEAANICMTVLHPTSSKDGRMKRYAVAIDGVQCGSRRVGPSLKRRFSVFGLSGKRTESSRRVALPAKNLYKVHPSVRAVRLHAEKENLVRSYCGISTSRDDFYAVFGASQTGVEQIVYWAI